MPGSIRAKLYCAFGVFVLLFLGAFGVGMRTLLDNNHDLERTSRDSINAAVQLAAAQDALWRLRYGFPQFMVGDAEARRKIVADEPGFYASIEKSLKAYEAGHRTQEELAALKDLREIYKRYIEARPKWFELYGAGKAEEAADWRAKTTTPFGAGTVKAFSAQIELQQKIAAERLASGESRLKQAQMMVLVVFVIALAVGVGFTTFVAAGLTRSVASMQQVLEESQRSNDLTRRVEIRSRDEIGKMALAFNALMDTLQGTMKKVVGGAHEVSSAATQVASASSQITQSARNQSESAASTAAAVEEVTVSIGQVAETTRETRTVSEQACQLSTEGEKTARETASQMVKTADSVGRSMKLLEDLSRRSNEISGIVKVIGDIAEQTNLLALNAAIEAARAGEQGRGFAVVADEVRKLAERTSTSTSEIAAMIEAIQNEVKSAVDNLKSNNEQVAQGKGLAEEVAAILARINEGARVTMQRIHDVSSAASEQTTASTDIAKNVERIARMTEETSAAIGQASSAAQQLETLASSLHGELGRFKV